MLETALILSSVTLYKNTGHGHRFEFLTDHSTNPVAELCLLQLCFVMKSVWMQYVKYE